MNVRTASVLAASFAVVVISAASLLALAATRRTSSPLPAKRVSGPEVTVSQLPVDRLADSSPPTSVAVTSDRVIEQIRGHSFFATKPSADRVRGVVQLILSKPDGFVVINSQGDYEYVTFTAYGFDRMPRRHGDSILRFATGPWTLATGQTLSIKFTEPFAVVFINAGLGNRLTEEYASALFFDSLSAQDITQTRQIGRKNLNDLMDMGRPAAK